MFSNQMQILFIELVNQYVLDGFDRHYQASVHFPLTSVVDKSKEIFWNAKNRTQILYKFHNTIQTWTLD